MARSDARLGQRQGRGLVQQTRDLLLGASYTLPLLAAVAAGLLIGIERGWRQRGEADGTRVAGVRTFTLIGGLGGLLAVVARVVSPLLAAVVAAGVVAAMLVAFLRPPPDPRRGGAPCASYNRGQRGGGGLRRSRTMST